jgi:hypothetical protein
MSLRRHLFFHIAVFLFLLFSSQVFAGTVTRLERLPCGESWFGLFFSDEHAGFSYERVREERSGYELYGESSVKMSSLVFSRDASTRETYFVNKDLTLRAFAVNQTIDGSFTSIKGEASPGGFKVVISARGKKKEKLLKSKGPVYPPMALNFLPLLQGAEPGKVFSISMLDVEAVKINKVKITVIGPDTLGNMKTVHLKNDLYPVDNDIWVDLKGNTVKESVRDGWIVTLAEGEKTTRNFISESALGRKDFIVNFSLIKVETPISQPSEVSRMVVDISDFPSRAVLTANASQKSEKLDSGKVLFTIDNALVKSRPETTAGDLPEPDKYLKPTDNILSDNPVVLAKKNEIVGDEKDPDKVVEKLTRWVASHVKAASSDSPSPLETLKKDKGNSLAHARLFASLARAAGIPTRPVSGLVYVREKGFLYHAWAECYIGYWLPVDPTLGEVPANATHVKLVEGDSPENLADLSEFIGKIKVKVIEQKHQ